MNREPTPTQPPEKNKDASASTAGRKVRSGDLLGDRGELTIVHAGREYRLRLTQSGKLILTA